MFIIVLALSEFPSFLRMHNIPLHFDHPSVKGCLGCVHDSAVVKNAGMNVDVQMCVKVTAFNSFRYISRSRMRGTYESPV